VSVTWLTPDWPAPARVQALSTTRGGGISQGAYASLNLGDHVGDDPAAVAANRRLLREAARLPAEPSWLRQVHGTAVVDLDALPALRPGSPPQADAAIARAAGRICAILTADCVPVLFAAADGSAVGAAHAGWRGLAAGVLAATVRALAVEPGALLAWIGPCIGAAAYEVGPEVRAALLAADPGAVGAFEDTRPGHWRADLPQLARRHLGRLGIRSIHGGGDCTHRDAGRFFSHRRDGQTGRQATLIWRADR
jgi:YfiH family protein